jgi:hypothetical protein
LGIAAVPSTLTEAENCACTSRVHEEEDGSEKDCSAKEGGDKEGRREHTETPEPGAPGPKRHSWFWICRSKDWSKRWDTSGRSGPHGTIRHAQCQLNRNRRPLYREQWGNTNIHRRHQGYNRMDNKYPHPA